jgi:predicted ArsR family transcriptional regulator
VHDGVVEIDRTRARVARLVGQEGPITVACLADRLGLTAAAVRRHLDAMLADGVVEPRVVGGAPRGRGRPARAFVLTEHGHASMATSYDDLAVQALQFLADEHGRDAVEGFARRRFDDLERRLAPVVDEAGDDPADRAQALAAALSGEGFAASSRPVGGVTPGSGRHQSAVQLCQGHCPVQHAAERFPELCEAESAAFSRLLGVDVRRLATLAQGDHVCTTHIPLGTRTQAATARTTHGPTTSRTPEHVTATPSGRTA